jgi:hypothetical protein
LAAFRAGNEERELAASLVESLAWDGSEPRAAGPVDPADFPRDFWTNPSLENANRRAHKSVESGASLLIVFNKIRMVPFVTVCRVNLRKMR